MSSRKIIHIDMDCFYAAIEMRDNPSLAEKPVAVGGSPDQRGVLCTCNYPARKFGVRSAMATAYALKLCPNLIVLPTNMQQYKKDAKIIHAIFREYTPIVEPLSLDEAYLDVSHSSLHHGSATLIAKEIRERIWQTLKLTASAGVAPNKFLAKIASGWKKPNGLFVIPPKDVDNFIKQLPIKEIHGVGKKTAEKLHVFGLHTCLDLQKISRTELIDCFGKLGGQLYDQCRGIDHRQVEPNRIRKSLSVERTFNKDIFITHEITNILKDLYLQLTRRIKEAAPHREIKNQYIKVKYSNFKQVTLEKANNQANFEQYVKLLFEIFQRTNIQIRLIGIGVHFICEEKNRSFLQQKLF